MLPVSAMPTPFCTAEAYAGWENVLGLPAAPGLRAVVVTHPMHTHAVMVDLP